jgi:hypothetical protein
MRVRLFLGLLVGAALVLPGSAAWLSVRAFKGRQRTPHTLEVDLGPVFLDPARPESWRAGYQFQFTNPSHEQTARLRMLYNSCGCSACLIERPVLGPGEHTNILLSMTVPYERQERREWAIIGTGLAQHEQIVVALAASFYPRIAIEVDALPEAGLPPGGTHTLHVTTTAYQSVQEKPARVRITCTDERVEVRAAGPPEVLRRGQVRREVRRWEVVLHGSSKEEAGASDELSAGRLVASYGPWQAVHELVWRRRPAITASAARVVLAPGTAGVATAKVELTSEEAFAILRIEASERLRVRYAAGGRARSHELAIEAEWDPSAGLARKGQVVVHTDHPRQARVELPVYVLYVGT